MHHASSRLSATSEGQGFVPSKCRLAQIVEWERIALHAKFRPSLMADLCLISLRQLERHFTERFNQTPRQWARALRCRLAKELIAKGWSNKAVAFELHFANESHLCHEFTHHFGDRPQAFGPSFPVSQQSKDVA